MLRLVLDWAARHRTSITSLRFDDGSVWYAEALLPTRFRPRKREDPAGEGFTHADAVIGHFRLRPGGRGDIQLLPAARQLTVVEAKMASGLSPGTKRAPEFNQAARNIACIAYLVSEMTAATPAPLTAVSFVLLAPATRIAEGVFASSLDKSAVCHAVARRATGYDKESDKASDTAASDWCKSHLNPLVERCSIVAVSWETVLTEITRADPDYGSQLKSFYSQCLLYNPIRPGKVQPKFDAETKNHGIPPAAPC
jgi:hypothetical protein